VRFLVRTARKGVRNEKSRQFSAVGKQLRKEPIGRVKTRVCELHRRSRKEGARKSDAVSGRNGRDRRKVGKGGLLREMG
jgi:hypothetical protein